MKGDDWASVLHEVSKHRVNQWQRTPVLLVSVLELTIVLLVHTTPDTTLYFTAFIIGRGCGGRAISTLASHQGEPGSMFNPRPVHREFRMWESCRTMPLVGGFSRDLPFPPPLHSGAAPYSPQSPSSALKTSLLRAAQISSLTHSYPTKIRQHWHGSNVFRVHTINTYQNITQPIKIGTRSTRQEHYTPVRSLALSGEGALDKRGNVVLIAPTLLDPQTRTTAPGRWIALKGFDSKGQLLRTDEVNFRRSQIPRAALRDADWSDPFRSRLLMTPAEHYGNQHDRMHILLQTKGHFVAAQYGRLVSSRPVE
ncbi:hypothetical protein PR048_033231 [Dryococelus australis]|uniref:Uncharacterized protein n=1 Tax=Dryococelus australis TaxID=614101 RepID=A0ABQ9G3Y6_9NEOP|nr:hypothetical protein PR048_033231 [Dryococelus australis]